MTGGQGHGQGHSEDAATFALTVMDGALPLDIAGLIASSAAESRGLTSAVCRSTAFSAFIVARYPIWASRVAAANHLTQQPHLLDFFDTCVQRYMTARVVTFFPFTSILCQELSVWFCIL